VNGRERGQAAVELVLVLPLLALVALVVLQVALVGRDLVLVVHAAREAARTAAVEPGERVARDAAVRSTGLDPSRLDVAVTGRGGAGSRVDVRVRYRAPTDVPLAGDLVGDLPLIARASMRVEK
jgi:Flp pilus assembly protein TadG